MVNTYTQQLTKKELEDAAENYEAFPYRLEAFPNVSLSALFGSNARRCQNCHGNAKAADHPNDCKPCVSLRSCPSTFKMGHPDCMEKYNKLKEQRRQDVITFKELMESQRKRKKEIKQTVKLEKEKKLAAKRKSQTEFRNRILQTNAFAKSLQNSPTDERTRELKNRMSFVGKKASEYQEQKRLAQATRAASNWKELVEQKRNERIMTQENLWADFGKSRKRAIETR